MTLWALGLPVVAGAVPISTDDTAGPIQALDGVIVWASGNAYKHQTLIQYANGAVKPVAGARSDTGYSSIDLGRDSKNRLVLTYLRCDRGTSVCKPYRNDLKGHEVAVKTLATSHCHLSTAPAYWRSYVAYGQACTIGTTKRDDPKHSGLYVKHGTSAPRQMHRPKDAIKYRLDNVTRADLRGTQVAAVVSDIYEIAYTQTLSGKSLQGFLISASEGESDEHVRSMALGSGSAMWTLVDSTHTGDPNAAYLGRAVGDCFSTETFESPANDMTGGYVVTSAAVDGATVYLVKPGVGIETHGFSPTRVC